MCGGRGTRLGGDTEKPLTLIRGRSMVDRVIDATTDASRVETVYAAVSPHTTETRAHLVETRPSVSIVDAPGDGYVSDLQYAVEAIGAARSAGSAGPAESAGSALLTVAADLPLLDGDAVDTVVGAAHAVDADSLTVCVPAERKRELGVSADTATEIDGCELVPAGINVISGDGRTDADGGSEGDADGEGDGDTDGEGDGDTDGEGDTDSAVYRTCDRRLAVNVNYSSDALIAERLLATGAPSEP